MADYNVSDLSDIKNGLNLHGQGLQNLIFIQMAYKQARINPGEGLEESWSPEYSASPHPPLKNNNFSKSHNQVIENKPPNLYDKQN